MKYLIVNADGFGFSEGCNRGIYETIQNGIVSSVSVNMNFPAAEDVLKLQRMFPQISIGVHLNPVVGQPVSDTEKISSLLNPSNNEFFGGPEFTRRLTLGKINLKELELELSSQLKKALNMGIQVTHIDSHQNRHLHPFYLHVFLKVGRKFGITKMRTHKYYLFSPDGRLQVYKYYLKNTWRFSVHMLNRINMFLARKSGFKMADRNLVFILLEKGAKYLLNNWIFILKNLPHGYNEVYIHPAYIDETLSKYASYVKEREAERKLLLEPILKEVIQEENIKLISFRELI